MNRILLKSCLLALPGVLAASAMAHPQQSASVADSGAVPASETPRAAANPPAQVFAFAVSTKSADARKLVESALDEYENVLLDRSVASARLATEKDPQFALAYAVWSFVARRTQPDAEALRKAEALAANAPPDEKQLVQFLTSVQKDDMLPAIVAMNELLARFPNDGHALYLTAEWLYFQQDYDRSVEMWEHLIQQDPNFAPAYNMLGYARVEGNNPDPAKALAYLRKYAELQPQHANPQDSLGEVSRYAGDDQGSLVHYRAALQITPTFITSQIGLGDTYTLMGDFAHARTEYAKAAAMATNDRDRLHIEFQKALVLFWEGRASQGLRALNAVEQKARAAKEPYTLFESQEALALLAATSRERQEKLVQIEAYFSAPVPGMSDGDRNPTLAAIWRDEARECAQQNKLDAAQLAVQKLEHLAAKSRDLIVEDSYESARGYVFFAQKKFQDAADELSADAHSPVAVKWLALARGKAGDAKGAEAAKLRFRYLQAPTAEWYLATHSSSVAANLVAPQRKPPWSAYPGRLARFAPLTSPVFTG
jgi:tetratricopeptide (TPR) repeat protein